MMPQIPYNLFLYPDFLSFYILLIHILFNNTRRLCHISIKNLTKGYYRLFLGIISDIAL